MGTVMGDENEGRQQLLQYRDYKYLLRGRRSHEGRQVGVVVFALRHTPVRSCIARHDETGVSPEVSEGHHSGLACRSRCSAAGGGAT